MEKSLQGERLKAMNAIDTRERLDLSLEFVRENISHLIQIQRVHQNNKIGFNCPECLKNNTISGVTINQKSIG